ncbi:hypothetical protein [uncultured Tateyamaria sp.]|uniref:hypothetical protein n=1 Tax=uncultured Tateyamaria sp. TaxID=455651 RepID=UPI002614861C|nr:hypothetical protein [uncultured Tateyamaria sp.]
MNILPILGAGATPASQPNVSEQPTETEQSNPQPAAAETEDTAPPAPASQAAETATQTTTRPSDPQTEPDKVAAFATSDRGSAVQSAVESALLEAPESSEDQARRFAEAAQSRQRLEQLIEAVNTPVQSPTTLSAATADQAAAGPTETDGVPV